MTHSTAHRTTKGTSFQLDVSAAPLPESADYWKFVVRATASAGPGLTFVVILRKRAYPTQDAADRGVLADPLTEIRSRLDLVDSDGIPLFWPNFDGDWAVA